MVCPTEQARRACLVISLLAMSALPCYPGAISGMVVPFGPDVRVELWYLDSEHHCVCDSYAGEKNLDRNGRFRFEDVPKGSYALVVIPDGLRRLPKTIEKVAVGDKAVSVGVIMLQPSAWVTVKVSPPGRYLNISPDPNPYTSCHVTPDGSMEVDGLPPGKHKLWVFQDQYVPQSVEVEITEVREYRLAPIELVRLSDVTGTITGKLLYEGSPASLDDLNRGRVQLHVYAMAADPDPRKPFVKYFTTSRNLDPTNGRYKIEHIPPGRYDLLACGPRCIIRGVGDLPADTSSASNSGGVLEAIRALGAAFDGGDEQSLSKLATADCVFQPPGVTAFLKMWREQGHVLGERRVILARVGGDRAVVFTRAQAISKKGRQGLPSEVIESWRFARVGSEWKLTRYWRESEMTQLLGTLRISSGKLPKGSCTVDQLPPVSIIVTDAPGLPGVSVEAGQVTSGHDFDLRAQGSDAKLTPTH